MREHEQIGEERAVCDIYSHLPTDTTADGEWEWAELIGLLDDECLRVCNSARAEQGRAWRNPELLHQNNLRDAVLAGYDLRKRYVKKILMMWLGLDEDFNEIEPMTYQDISDELGCTRENVRQKINRVLKQLQTNERIQKAY